MIQLSLPTRVTPPAPGTPILKVQNSRIVLRSPITSSVGSPAYFLSCGMAPSEANWKIAVVAADRGAPLDHAMRADRGAGADPHMRADHGVRADAHRRVEFGLGIDDGRRMNLGHASSSDQLIWRMAHISVASQASSLPTSARPLNLEMPAFMRSISTSSVSWSPGSTGRLKRAPSMAAK